MNLELRELRRVLAAGTGVGIEIEDDLLRVAAVRVRPNGARLIMKAVVPVSGPGRLAHPRKA